MKLTIESTDCIELLHGVPCRLWKGVHADGTVCVLFVPAIGAPGPEHQGADFAADAARDHIAIPIVDPSQN